MLYYPYLNFEYFCYSIQELSIERKKIKIDLNSNKTIEDIKEKIASEIQIPSDKIQFEHAPCVELKDLKRYYNFQLSINYINRDLNIQLPNGKMTQIKNCYKKNLKGIIEFLESEGFYYTQKFIKNNFHLYLAGKEIRDEKFPFLSANRFDSLCIKTSGPVIKAEHGKFQFYISETDYTFEVTQLIERAYPNNKASFLDMNGMYLNPLKSSEQYVICVETKVKFRDVDGANKDLNPITDLNKKLSDIKSLDEIFLYKIDTSKKISPQPSTDISPPKSTAYPLIVSKPPESMSKDSIDPTPTEKKTEPVKPAVAEAYDKKVPSDSLIITIVCDKSSERKFLPIKKSFKLKSTIKDVKDYIVLKNKLKKNDKVTIKYKRDDALVGVFASLTIDGIKDKIQEKIKDKIENVLYYEIKSKGKDESESESKSDYSDDESIPKSAAKKKSDEIEERNEKSKKSSSESEENNDDEDKNPRLKKASNNRSKEIDEEPGKIKTVKRPKRSASSCKPKIIKEPQSPASPKNPTHASEFDFFVFIFDEKTRKIRLDINSPFEDNIDTVKSKFCIDPSDEIEFQFTDAAGDTTRIRDTSTKMKKFIKGKIYVYKQTGKETTKNNKNDKKNKNKKSPPSDEDDSEDEIPSVKEPTSPINKNDEKAKKVFPNNKILFGYTEEVFIDLYDTVLKARELLYKKLNPYRYGYFSKPNYEQDNLFILDEDFNPITDLNKKLSDIKSLDQTFYYKIDTSKKLSPQLSTETKPLKPDTIPMIICKPPELRSKDSIDPTPTEKKTKPVKPAVAEAYDKKVPSDSLIITIVCDKSSERKFLPIKKSFKLKSTIKDVKDYIVLKNKLKKNDKVTIKYKRDDALVGTFWSLTIDEIKDKIQEKIKDKIENVLYYEIKSKGKDESESESKSDYSDDESIPKSSAKPTVDYAEISKKKSDEIEELNEKSKKSSSESEENNNDEDKGNDTDKGNDKPMKRTNNRSKEIDEEPGKIKTVKRPRRSASSCKPKIIKETQSPASPKNPTHASEFDFFVFIFDEKTRKIRLDIKSPFEDNIETVKSKFCIDPSDEIEFQFTDAAGDTTRIRDTSTKMKKFIKGKIYVYKQTGKETTKNNKNDKKNKNKKSPPSDEDDSEDEILFVKNPVNRFGKKKSPKWKDEDEDDSDDETRAKPSLIRKKGPVKPKKVDSDEDDSNDEEPKKVVKKKTVKGPAKSKKVDSDEDDSDNETRAKPSLRRKKGPTKSKEVDSDEDDSDNETRAKPSLIRKKWPVKPKKIDSDEDDSDDEEPKNAAKKKTAKNPIKTKKFDSDSDDEDDDKGGKKKSAKKKPAKSSSDDDDDDEENPKKKPSKSKHKKPLISDDDDD